MSPEQLAAVEELVKEGYYLPEANEQRKADKVKADKVKIIDDLRKQRDTTVNKANTEYKIKIFVLQNGLPIDNFIYYNHTNEGSFNWKDYDKKITESEFKKFCDTANFETLPQGIKFSLKDLKIQYAPNKN